MNRYSDTRPSSDDCTAKRVTDHGDHFSLITWHPQWGGYCSPAEVVFDRSSGVGSGDRVGCFGVRNWHDGEFPTSDVDETTSYHYCNAEQIADFGLDVLEAQVGRQVSCVDGSVIAPNTEWIDRTIARLQRMRGSAPPQSGTATEEKR